MFAPQNILNVWRKFDGFPMERLTKLWFYNQESHKKQRDVALMKKHRSQYGISGNCFDLAIWLLDELQKDGITAYPIGQQLNSENAHVAVIAVDESGNFYLCDLGDQWINPILIDKNNENYTDKKLSGFFPGADVQVIPKGQDLEILYHRPNGKVSKQVYNIDPIDIDYFLLAAEHSQNLINPKPLLECRIPYKNEIAHWEFSNWESFLSTSEGLFVEQELDSIEKWAYKINEVSGYDIKFLINVLEQYKEFSQ
ncbi:hypothetical protein CR203_19115 [Salipaludibacillus neizhouensis]|uniref:Arylamine N-acetyltransferase n=1 Tax=Salipaludibacillus neizhouensis TaxID=885475 RepID=A0A3A9K032_9BACI|nr:hypothetical protein [Salipaludibacillus neizhouensis]RKL65759.1 hypothetical protein CR203_19115 [Salipaludibacillus neizhouensis]